MMEWRRAGGPPVALLSALAAAVAVAAAQAPPRPPLELPASAVHALVTSLSAARQYPRHVWRDTPPFVGAEVQAYVEIPRGETRKFEFDIGRNLRRIDRVMPPDVGPYPVNYGFVPQTISYDGDPFDVLVLGPSLPAGELARGVIVGLMLMEDEKGIDSKVVIAASGRDSTAAPALTEEVQALVGAYFRRYKRHEPGRFSRVPGWGTVEQGLAHVLTTHAFFRQCQQVRRANCRVR